MLRNLFADKNCQKAKGGEIMTIKDQVKIALIQKGWSQRELARRMDISMGYLQDILNGNRTPEERLVQIEGLLEISIQRKQEAV